jgi:hypothetical protein
LAFCETTDAAALVLEHRREQIEYQFIVVDDKNFGAAEMINHARSLRFASVQIRITRFALSFRKDQAAARITVSSGGMRTRNFSSAAS